MLIIKTPNRDLSQEEVGRAEAMCAGSYDGFKYTVKECASRFGITPAALKKLLPALKRPRRTSAEKQAQQAAKAEQKGNPKTKKDRKSSGGPRRAAPQARTVRSPAMQHSAANENNAAHGAHLTEDEEDPGRRPNASRAPADAEPGRLHEWKPGQTAVLDGVFVTVLHHVEPDLVTVQNDYNRQQTVKTDRLEKPADHLARAS